jgi:hypothetical protein
MGHKRSKRILITGVKKMQMCEVCEIHVAEFDDFLCTECIARLEYEELEEEYLNPPIEEE